MLLPSASWFAVLHRRACLQRGFRVALQDPFELSHDLGRTVDRQTSMVLHKEFERAACILRDLPGGVDKLFEPYRAGKAE